MSTSSAAHRTYSFGEFTLDVDRGALLSAGADIKLRPKSFEVLSYLVERHGQLVTKDELLDAIWGETVVTEDSVTHCLIDIRKAIRDRSRKKIRTVPGRGYIFDLPVTKHGGLVTASDAPSSSKLAPSWPRWRLAAALVLIFGVVAVWWGFGDRGVKLPVTVELQSAVSPRSIAVLPFLDMSPEQDQAYFADGISEEILNRLAQIPGLRVIARTSSFSFKGQNANITTIAKQLNVAHVLEGSVRKSSNRIRITAQLVNASTSEHLWSKVYDRELEKTFAVQDEISAAIVGALEEHLGPHTETAPRAAATLKIDAHDAYLKGRHLLVQRTRVTVEGAAREFEKAIALDPDYALAHAELAIALVFLHRGHLGDLTLSEAVARAAPHAEQAMALDPTLAEAYAATGQLFARQWNLEEALTHYQHAIQINPNYAIAYNWMAILLDKQFGRYAEGFTAFETAQRLDPLSHPIHFNYVSGLIARNQLAEADRELENSTSFASSWNVELRGKRMSLGGQWANRALGGLDALRIDPERVWTRSTLSFLFAILGLKKEALEISDPVPPYVLSMLGRPGYAVTAAEAHLAEDPADLDLLDRRDLALALAGAGDYARARPILEGMWQRSAGRITCCDRFQIKSAAALIAIRRDAGEDADVGELVVAIRDNVHRYREAGIVRADLYFSVDYEEGLVAFLSGERERGLALIAKGAEDGFFIPPSEAYMQGLYDDPGFAPIRASQEARQARERKRFLGIVCTDNPYAMVWRPAEGTCEQSAAVGGN